MPSTFNLPDDKAVSEMLEMLLGRPISVHGSHPLDTSAETALMIASFITDKDEVGALCVWELSLAAYAGAALSLIPADSVKDLSSGDLTETITENLHEVSNVLVGLFNRANVRRLSLQSLIDSRQPLPVNTVALLREPADRLDLEVEIPGYGKGSLALMSGLEEQEQADTDDQVADVMVAGDTDM